MCTVLLRFAPGAVVVGAVRDEFVERQWQPPAEHWPSYPGLLGGRDLVSGGTWLAVDPERPALAALLNGQPLPAAKRPTRGTLPLHILTHDEPPDPAEYDTFHLLRATLDRVEMWSWDGAFLQHEELAPGDHVIVNAGADAQEDPLVPSIAPQLAKASTRDDWVELLSGGGMDPTDPRALIIRHERDGMVYGSTSVSLVELTAVGVHYDFAADPHDLGRRPAL